MTRFTFDAARSCPKCEATFESAEKMDEYDPVVVVVCPACGALLWRPGFDASSSLFPFDPDAAEETL